MRKNHLENLSRRLRHHGMTWLPTALAACGLLALAATGADLLRLVAALPLLACGLPVLWVGDDDDEDDYDETAKTIVSMPAFMAEDIEKERQRILAERKQKEEAEAASTPAREPEPAPEPKEEPQTARTMAFSPADAAAFRETAQTPPAPEPKEEPQTARTMAFSPADAAAFRETAQTPPAPEPKEEDLATAQTVMFDAREAGFMAETPVEEKPPVEESVDQTAAYSAEDVKRLQGTLEADRDREPEDEGNARTMAYMPAMSPDAVPETPAPEEEDEGTARTVAYMPAVSGESETVAYSAEDKERILTAIREGRSPQEALDSISTTQAYSPEQSKALKEAYDLLEQARQRAPADAGIQAQARELLEKVHETEPGILRAEAEKLLHQTKEIPAQQPTPKAVQAAPSLTSDLTTTEKSGMGTVPLIVILLLLLALAGAATAFILHFVGLIDLPVDLPQLDLFKE